MSMHDLRFGFDVELAQLTTQPSNRLFHFFDMKFDRIDLLTQARMVNADFASRIQ